MSYWTDNHPGIPEPQMGDQGTYAFAEITVNGVKLEIRFKSKEAMYIFCNAYEKAIYVEGSFDSSDHDTSIAEMKAFWNWQACREFIEQAVKHYEHAPVWFVNWLDDLYIRLDEQRGSITLDEIQTLGMLTLNDTWEAESLAVNRVYKLFDRLGRDTTGIAGY